MFMGRYRNHSSLLPFSLSRLLTWLSYCRSPTLLFVSRHHTLEMISEGRSESKLSCTHRMETGKQLLDTLLQEFMWTLQTSFFATTVSRLQNEQRHNLRECLWSNQETIRWKLREHDKLILFQNGQSRRSFNDETWLNPRTVCFSAQMYAAYIEVLCFKAWDNSSSWSKLCRIFLQQRQMNTWIQLRKWGVHTIINFMSKVPTSLIRCGQIGSTSSYAGWIGTTNHFRTKGFELVRFQVLK